MNAEKRKSEDDDKVEKRLRRDEGGIYRMKGYYADRKGERDEMQDSHMILDEFRCDFVNATNSEIRRLSYYAVFDGHAGARASRFAAEHVHKNWASTLPSDTTLATLEQNAKRCFVEAYKKTDEQFLGEAVKVKPVWKDGTTATALFVINNTLYVTNLGDSKALLCRYKISENKEVPMVLTKEHNPTAFDERMRIQKAGGTVKDGRIMGILEVSRSIGDGQFKNYGVTCVPDVQKCALTENDRYILIACDGLWKTFSSVQAVEYIAELRKHIWKDEKLMATEDRPLSDLRWETLCQRLAAEAVRRGSGDNVTVLIVVIGETWYDH